MKSWSFGVLFRLSSRLNQSDELSGLRLTVPLIVRTLCLTWSGQESSTLPKRRSLAPYCESNVMYKEAALKRFFCACNSGLAG